MTKADPILIGLIQQVFQIEARQRAIIEVLCGQPSEEAISLTTPEWLDHRTQELMTQIATTVQEMKKVPE